MSYIDPRSKLLRQFDLLAAIKYDRPHPPLNVEIDPAEICNCGCNFCHFGFTHVGGPLAGKVERRDDYVDCGGMLDIELGRSILEQLSQFGVKSVTWTGGGEPTVNPRFVDLVERAGQLGLEQGLYTNAIRNKPDMWQAIKSHLMWVVISLDYAGREQYKAIKVVDTFDWVIENTKLLVRLPGDAKIGLSFLLERDNWRTWPRMLEIGQETGASYIEFRPTVLYKQQSPNELDEDTSWMNAMIPVLDSLVGTPNLIVDPERFRQYRDWKGHGYPICWWSKVQTCITANGKVWVCVNKRGEPTGLIGDLTKETFADIWARHKACPVDGTCRCHCRGHTANLTLTEVLTDHPHGNFV